MDDNHDNNDNNINENDADDDDDEGRYLSFYSFYRSSLETREEMMMLKLKYVVGELVSIRLQTVLQHHQPLLDLPLGLDERCSRIVFSQIDSRQTRLLQVANTEIVFSLNRKKTVVYK